MWRTDCSRCASKLGKGQALWVGHVICAFLIMSLKSERKKHSQPRWDIPHLSVPAGWPGMEHAMGKLVFWGMVKARRAGNNHPFVEWGIKYEEGYCQEGWRGSLYAERDLTALSHIGLLPHVTINLCLPVFVCIRKKFFSGKVIIHWNWLPREVVGDTVPVGEQEMWNLALRDVS